MISNSKFEEKISKINLQTESLNYLGEKPFVTIFFHNKLHPIMMAYNFQLKYFSFNIFRFAQSFIDIREKEKKRGARGLITVPQKFDKFPSTGSDANDTHESEDAFIQREGANGPIKAEDLIELQEKITKEILGSKLQESERNELQVSSQFNETLFSFSSSVTPHKNNWNNYFHFSLPGKNKS